MGLIENIARRHFPEGEQVIMFTLKEFVPIVMNGMEWLFEQTGKFFNVRILPMSVLVQILVNESQQPEYQQGSDNEPSKKIFYEVQHESQLEEPLHDTFYAYSPELACEFHSKPENECGVENCSENNVKSLIFNACKVLTPFYRVNQQKNNRYPCYRAPITKPMTRNGLKVYEVPNIRRMAEIKRFASSDRMSDLRSQSHSGLSSSETSSDRSSPAPTTSSDNEDGSGSYSDGSIETVELDPPDESAKLRSLFKVEQELQYGHCLNQFLPRVVPRVAQMKMPSVLCLPS
ncbi:unnamed protein product [Allacma fusca]|uniref:Maelstrom domain-containing protein n=1 Tax=Allacma fusca TaxID=39272 RepID=A0A8J2NYX7_9HEXA|nr:unnamed protein product [Allacma fusca]